MGDSASCTTNLRSYGKLIFLSPREDVSQSRHQKIVHDDLYCAVRVHYNCYFVSLFKTFSLCSRAFNENFLHAQSGHRGNVDDNKISRILLAMVLAYAVCITPLTVVESIDFGYFVYFISVSISASVNPY